MMKGLTIAALSAAFGTLAWVGVANATVDLGPSEITDAYLGQMDECTYEDEREFSIPVESTVTLMLNTGSGALEVEGRDGLEEISVTARICASHEEFLDEMDVDAQRLRGGDVSIDAIYPDDRNDRDGRRVARIDLTVLIPRGLDVDVDDSSGHAEISGTGHLYVDDSSGDLQVRDIDGTVRIDDSSGSVDVQDVSGDVEIDDSSGGLDVRRVGGSLYLRDGSGGIDVVSVEGDLIVESDGSGSIDVRDVGGDFVVEQDGSGGIRHAAVGGRVDIPRKRR